MSESFSDRNPILSSFLGATAVGGGAAAISALLSDILETKRQRDKKRRRLSKNLDSNTVVLHVRGGDGELDKQGSDSACSDNTCTPYDCDETCSQERKAPAVEPTISSAEVKYNPEWSQPRTSTGQYSSFNKIAGLGRIGTNTGRITSVVVGLPLGYFAVDALHRKLEENRLKKQIAAAQQEYIDLFDGKQVKGAEAFLDTFLFDTSSNGNEKSAQARTRVGRGIDAVSNAFNKATDAGGDALSWVLASMLLTGGASAWLTHKILKRKFDRGDGEEDPTPVTRVVVKQGSSEIPISPECFIGTIAIMRDRLRGGVIEKTAAALPDDQVEQLTKLYNGYNIWRHIPNVSGNPTTWVQYLKDLRSQGKLPADKTDEELLDGIYYIAGRNDRQAGRGISQARYLSALYDQLGPEYGIERGTHANIGSRGYLGGYFGDTDQDVIMSSMKNDPEAWVAAYGSEAAAPLREAVMNKYYDDLRASNKGMGWWYSIPVLGPIMESISRLYTGSKWGQRTLLRRTLAKAGITGDKAEKIINSNEFSSRGWKAKPEPSGNNGPAAKPPVADKPADRPAVNPPVADKPAGQPAGQPAANPLPGDAKFVAPAVPTT